MVRKELITVSLTTLPERQEALKEVVKSLLPQVDKLNVFLHGYKELPVFLQNKKIEVAFDLEWGDKGDLDKLHWTKEVKGYHLLCDDDLIYPKDYVKKMIQKIDQYGKKVIISFHGAIPFNPPIASYYLDRYTFPCLGTVPIDTKVTIGGSGVMGYHTRYVLLKGLEIKDLMPNMCDIHIGLWAAGNNIGIITAEHQEGWLKHSDKVDLNNTIYAKAVNDDFFPTEMININAKYFKTRVPNGVGPLVTIVCINSRLRSNRQFVREAFTSFREQDYGNLEIVTVENLDKLITVGKGFNEGVKKAKGEYILFVGDDDVITYDYVGTLVIMMEKFKSDPKVVGVTSYLTMFNVGLDGVMKKEPRDLIPTGMWKRSWLLENPFKEYLTRFVDTELMERAKELGFLQPACDWHYGYYYRSHPAQVSGHKLLITGNGQASQRTDEIKKRVKEV